MTPPDDARPGCLSRLYRVSAGAKLGALALAGTATFLVSDWRVLAFALLAVIVLAILTGAPWRESATAWRAACPVLALVLIAQGVGGDWADGVADVLRLSTLMLLAGLVTLTTRQSDMTAAITAGLRPLRRLDLDPVKPALALSLSMRLLPLIAAEAATVREAQRARGLDRSPLALFVPLIVRLLKMADELADAIEARSGDSN